MMQQPGMPQPDQQQQQYQQQWMMQQQQQPQPVPPPAGWTPSPIPPPTQYGAAAAAVAQGSGGDVDDIKSLWIGDLQQWMDENYLISIFASTGEVLIVIYIVFLFICFYADVHICPKDQKFVYFIKISKRMNLLFSLKSEKKIIINVIIFFPLAV